MIRLDGLNALGLESSIYVGQREGDSQRVGAAGMEARGGLTGRAGHRGDPSPAGSCTGSVERSGAVSAP
ncbi:MAG: hypothetical protein P8Y03_30080 [Anaerolineales bacterium]